MIGRTLAVASLLAALALDPAAAQQPGKMYRVAAVGAGPASCEFPPPDVARGTPWEGHPWHPLEIHLRIGLRDVGLVDGRNLVIERYCFETDAQIPAMAAHLATRNADAALAWGLGITRALKSTMRAPIVFIGVPDPVRTGLVVSMARPGGNVTGVYSQVDEVAEKRVQLTRELLLRGRTLDFMHARDDANTSAAFPKVSEYAARFGFEARHVPVDGWAEVEAALRAMRQQRPDVLLVYPDGTLSYHAERLFRLAADERIPTVCNTTIFVEQGCLMAYSIDFSGSVVQVGRLLGRVLLGADPATTPVEQSTKFELLINLKTAKALGIEIPASLLARADRVIE